MKLFLRLFIVLSFAMMAIQGARAHARDADPTRPAVAACAHMRVSDEAWRTRTAASGPVHVAANDDRQHAPHHRCLCCTTDCGAHCTALIDHLRFCAHAGADGLAQLRAVPPYSGITRAPPVRPPIVRV
jgi:hypothetical protein